MFQSQYNKLLHPKVLFPWFVQNFWHMWRELKCFQVIVGKLQLNIRRELNGIHPTFVISLQMWDAERCWDNIQCVVGNKLCLFLWSTRLWEKMGSVTLKANNSPHAVGHSKLAYGKIYVVLNEKIWQFKRKDLIYDINSPGRVRKCCYWLNFVVNSALASIVKHTFCLLACFIMGSTSSRLG